MKVRINFKHQMGTATLRISLTYFLVSCLFVDEIWEFQVTTSVSYFIPLLFFYKGLSQDENSANKKDGANQFFANLIREDQVRFVLTVFCSSDRLLRL